jgi:GGDEF domain-containing protein
MMEVNVERDYLSELSSAISCYLSLLSSVADCVGLASPEVGGPYRKRISQLRTRLFFQTNAKSLKSSLKAVEGELNDYAVVAAQFLDQHDLDLRRAIVTLERVIDTQATCHDFHRTQLLELAARMEDPGPGQQPVSARELAGELRRSVESMNRETASMLEIVRKEVADVEARLRGTQSTDPSTGLLNARELMRQVDVYRSSGVVFTLLRFEFHGTVTEPVMKQAAGRVEKQFRHRDRIARWSDAELMVLFQGPAEVAETRASQVAKILSGRYQTANGGQIEIMVQGQVADLEASLV